MTTTQSFKIYERLQSYSIDKDEAKQMISEIERVLKPNKSSGIWIEKDELVSKKSNSLKLQLEKERKFSKNIL